MGAHADDIESSRNELALFAPTSAAVTAAGWGTSAASALTHTLLFHIVPATETVRLRASGHPTCLIIPAWKAGRSLCCRLAGGAGRPGRRDGMAHVRACHERSCTPGAVVRKPPAFA